jgi:hypothetical protein
VPCKNCASTRQQDLKVELMIVFPDRERLNPSPVCIRQKALVCAECGCADLVISTADVEELRKNLEALDSTEVIN